MVGTGAIIAGLLLGGVLMTRADPSVPNVRVFRSVRMANSAMRSGSLFSWSLIGKAFRAYLRHGFTPESIGSTAQAVAYLAKSPAAKAAAHG